MTFVPLHVHSDHSLHDGFQSVKDICKFVSGNMQGTFALTDHGTMSGCGEGFRYAKDYDIKFIAGCEHYLVPDVTIKDKNYQHIILLAMNATGYRNLNILTTEAHKNFYAKPRLDLELLALHNEGIICTTACLAGCQNKVRALKEIFGDRLYIEIHTNQQQEQKDANVQWLKIAEKFDVPFYVATDSHYTVITQAEAHRNWVFSSGDAYSLDDYYMYTEGDIRKKIAYLGYDVVDLSIATTQTVADRCNFILPMGGNHYPKSSYPDPKQEIRLRTWAGCKEKKIDTNPTHIAQIKHEIEVLEKVDYFDYFLIISDLINWCESNGIRVGSGRGSVVGCDVAYAMGITKVDPIKQGLIFERFAHTERISPADIDVDVPKGERQRVIQYIKDTYGEVYQVVTFGKLANKSAIKLAGRALAIDHNIVDELCKNINDIEDLPLECPDKKLVKFEYELLVKMANTFKGKLYSYGTHASAVVVLTTDPFDYCAIERFSDGVYNLNYEFKDLEAIGLLKLDILGLETLDVISECLSYLPSGLYIDLENLPESEEVYKTLIAGYTKGVFQLESGLMTGLIKQVEPKNIEDLTHIVALGRPAPLQAGIAREFIDGKRASSI